MHKIRKKKSDTLHTLCTPLTVIHGYISLIEEGDCGETPIKVKEALCIIKRSTSKLESEVRKLVDEFYY